MLLNAWRGKRTVKLASNEMQLPYLYRFLCHLVSGLRFAYNSQTDAFL